MNHNCGGTLVPMRYQIDIEVDGFSLPFMVDGFQCVQCGERIMSRDTAVNIYARVENFRNALLNVASTKSLVSNESSTDKTVRSRSYDYFPIPV